MNRKKIIIIVAVILVLISALTFLYLNFNKKNETSNITLSSDGVKKVGETFSIDVNLETGPKAINAAEVNLKFDPGMIEVVSVDREGSFFQIWIEGQPTFSKDGTISFAGGLPTPGFKGEGKIGTIKAKALNPGTTSIKFEDKSRMLLDDGEGTEVKLMLEPIEINVR